MSGKVDTGQPEPLSEGLGRVGVGSEDMGDPGWGAAGTCPGARAGGKECSLAPAPQPRDARCQAPVDTTFREDESAQSRASAGREGIPGGEGGRCRGPGEGPTPGDAGAGP